MFESYKYRSDNKNYAKQCWIFFKIVANLRSLPRGLTSCELFLKQKSDFGKEIDHRCLTYAQKVTTVGTSSSSYVRMNLFSEDCFVLLAN